VWWAGWYLPRRHGARERGRDDDSRLRIHKQRKVLLHGSYYWHLLHGPPGRQHATKLLTGTIRRGGMASDAAHAVLGVMVAATTV